MSARPWTQLLCNEGFRERCTALTSFQFQLPNASDTMQAGFVIGSRPMWTHSPVRSTICSKNEGSSHRGASLEQSLMRLWRFPISLVWSYELEGAFPA